MRCFVSIDIPDELRQKIINLQKELPEGAACTRPETLHFTLKFLGDVDDTRSIVKKLSFLRERNSFQICLAGAGAFPSEKSARIVWIGAESQELINLQKSVEKALGQENEKFVPHITIARIKHTSPDLPEFIQKNRHTEIGEMRAFCVKLKKSELLRSGAVYTDIEIFELISAETKGF